MQGVGMFMCRQPFRWGTITGLFLAGSAEVACIKSRIPGCESRNIRVEHKRSQYRLRGSERWNILSDDSVETLNAATYGGIYTDAS
jgi:hypothetical protein